MSDYGSGSGRYLAKRLRDLAAEVTELAAFAERLPVEKNEGEIAHGQAMQEWKDAGGFSIGPPPVPGKRP